MSFTFHPIELQAVLPFVEQLKLPDRPNLQAEKITKALKLLELIPENQRLSQYAVVMKERDEVQGLAMYQLNTNQLFIVGHMVRDANLLKPLMDNLVTIAKTSGKKAMEILAPKSWAYGRFGFAYNDDRRIFVRTFDTCHLALR